MKDKPQLTDGEHYYLSTACLHGHHSYCVAPTVIRDGDWEVVGPSYSSNRDEPKNPAQCKFCPARCICRCHHEDAGLVYLREKKVFEGSTVPFLRETAVGG